MPDKLTIEQAAEFLGVKAKTLSNWIWMKQGPRHYKYGRRLWFDRKDLEAFRKSLIEVRAS